MSVNETIAKNPHYNQHGSGVEAYKISGNMWCPNLAQAVQYIIRHQYKGEPVKDIRKAAQFIDYEVERRGESDFSLPPHQAGRYNRAFEPFYVYIAHERATNPFLADLMAGIWSADKVSDNITDSSLIQCAHRLRTYADELEKAIGTSSQPIVAHPVEAKTITDKLSTLRKAVNNGDLAEWENWELWVEEAEIWQQIESVEHLGQGRMRFTVSVPGAESVPLDFRRVDEITLRPAQSLTGERL